ncbi:MAG: tRNA-modifying protein YgfZ [Gammaproteobacteria bacterium]|nr:tRNA-modifying protein YgfZ [Gammaproteobacteria bacterium]
MPTSLTLTSFDIFPDLTVGLTKLTGADNVSFLQGQLTCDVATLTKEHSLLGGHCDPKGKMLAVVRLFQYQDSILALQAANNAASHLPSLKKYAVFSKVDISVCSDQFTVIGLAGEEAKQWLIEYANYPAQPVNDNDCFESPFGLLTSAPFGQRFLLIATKQQAQDLLTALPQQAATQSNDVWHALDLLSGSPEITPQTQAQFVPQMLNLQMIDGISFKKGCYIGQETVARMHFRGLNKRSMFILRATSQLSVNVGDSLERQVESGWRNAGTIIGVQTVEQQTIITAVLPSDSEPGAVLKLTNTEDTLILSTPNYFELKTK